MKKPVIGITAGDPNGVGPELADQAALHRPGRAICSPLIMGSAAAIGSAAACLGVSLSRIPLFNSDPCARAPRYGKTEARSGREALIALNAALGLVTARQIDGIATAPLSKEAVALSGVKGFHGHTDYIAEYAGIKRYCLALYAAGKTIAFVTLHEPLRTAIRMVTRERVVATARLLNGFLKGIGVRAPRIGVSGLNPHAGEGGMFGAEEEREIVPAVKQLNREGIRASLPVPPDVVFAQLFGDKFHGVVSMVHDHGHVAFKTALFSLTERRGRTAGVNVTLGIPFIRTSVDHGTAFDIAGKGVADPGSMIDAITLAATMARKGKTV